ncbi:hypothetical protein BAOM_3097 [Peribacillus asahii]|uniref:Transcriptional regulator n=1 Tax=Peribacillus asahii TaxID=228899 RepID=A0A3T0KTG1_9BACI|nr:hypothetical protein [Peribacillus asahii]AZV43706.1 hypothetical protein BAOM_3097 [Peribacillus asahii]
MDYFTFITNRLTHEDLSMLNVLYSEDSTNVLKALNKKQLLEQTQISDFTFKRSLLRLEAMGMIEIANGKKHHQYFITHFGKLAIEKITEEVSV